MKKKFLIFIILLIIGFSVYHIYNTYYKMEKVSEVIDGDTIKLSNNKFVRLIGINAPEVDEPCYKEAREKLIKLVKGKTVRLESDVKNKDSYGRLLRYVYVDNLFVNSEMIRLGYAKVDEFKPNIRYSSLFLEMEDKARRANRCIWR